jgi:hypothetical protein
MIGALTRIIGILGIIRGWIVGIIGDVRTIYEPPRRGIMKIIGPARVVWTWGSDGSGKRVR